MSLFRKKQRIADPTNVKVEKIRAWQAIALALIGVFSSMGTILIKEYVSPSASQQEVTNLEKTIENNVERNIEAKSYQQDGSTSILRPIKGTVPIGSIISSTIDYATFSEVNGLPIIFDAKKSIWAPCDGRKVEGSKYAESGLLTIPDLRGVFIRGVNQMFPENRGAGALNEKQLNRGRSAAGVFQNDALQNHTHAIGMGRSDKKADSQIGKLRFADFAANSNPGKHSTHGVNPSSAHLDSRETRPKNVSVYYYVKIN
ncbi:MAG: hypothetical protein R8P61_00630 [Bacteroidia bacterium]|nr:hypothetical protein [Bacteroidia bacterium]